MARPNKFFIAVLITELVILILAVCAYFFYPQPQPITVEIPPLKTDYKIVAVGDIACSPSDKGFNSGSGTDERCQMNSTAKLTEQLNPEAVLALGDLQYEQGEYQNYLQSYQPTWGGLKTKTFPAIGNHEYVTTGAAGFKQYFADFNQQKIVNGTFDSGYYSFNIGDWHLIALNSNCREVGGCEEGSPQYAWLKSDLDSNQQYQCTLAYWHHPRFTSGIHTANNETDLSKPFWELLAKYKADVTLNGHDHLYERFAPQTANGLLDLENGIRQFTSGAGGKSLYKETRVAGNREFFDNKNFGVLELTLSKSSYVWNFHTIGGTIADTGTSSCH